MLRSSSQDFLLQGAGEGSMDNGCQLELSNCPIASTQAICCMHASLVSNVKTGTLAICPCKYLVIIKQNNVLRRLGRPRSWPEGRSAEPQRVLRPRVRWAFSPKEEKSAPCRRLDDASWVVDVQGPLLRLFHCGLSSGDLDLVSSLSGGAMWGQAGRHVGPRSTVWAVHDVIYLCM